MKKNLLFIVNSADFFLSHRLPLAIAAKNAGYRISVACPIEKSIDIIRHNDFEFYELKISRSGQNFFREISTFFHILLLLLKVRPDIVHLITIKPIVYGGIAARLARISSVVSAVPGLGSFFLGNSPLDRIKQRLVLYLYSIAFRHPNHLIIFQNQSDRDMLLRSGVFRHPQARLIPGSGINLDDYPYLSEPCDTAIVVMAARLLRDKGVFEFIEAARILHEKNTAVEMRLLGSIDPDNPSSVTQQDINHWKHLEYVKLLGYKNDMAQQYAQCNIACLPSYREGLPKSLIEAAACGRAIVTTDVPGCRDAIIPGDTGLLVPVKNPEALADAIKSLIAQSMKRKEMGKKAREFAEKTFSIEHVVECHLSIYNELLK